MLALLHVSRPGPALKHLGCIALVLLLASLAGAAQPALPVLPAMQAAYQKGTRDPSGAPGARYWQNTARYRLDVRFDPATREVQGSVAATYRNNSPDTLRQLWFKLYPNLYKKGTERTSRIPEAELGEGVDIQSLQVNGRPTTPAQRVVEGTNLHLPIAALAPGHSLQLKLTYRYTLNKGYHVRTGQIYGGAFFVAYFFPRIAVYDDVDGWNKLPYRGREEFYNDFCDFEAAITVPRDYAVWATGDLRNARQVLQPRIRQRLEQAEKTDGLRYVIDSLNLKNKAVTRQRAWNTWRFAAKNVTDFVFALSDHYVWQAGSLVVDSATGRRTRVDAVFNPRHRDFYEVADFARQTVQAMSFTFPKWPFPYAHETVFDGRAEMEYPMMVNQSPSDTREAALTTADHEVFHTMFPFYVGTNESKHAWMDEGWAAMGEWLITSLIDSAIVDAYGVKEYGEFSGNPRELPIATPSPQLDGTGYSFNSYVKAGLGYLYVKDLLGDELFTKALHHYIGQWRGRHPQPLDFFNSLNAGAGRNLNWFWQRWYFDPGVVDLAIKSVSPQPGGYAVQVDNKGGKPLPVDLTFTYADGSTEKLHRSIAVWEQNAASITLVLSTSRQLHKVVLGSTYVPDKVPADNVFEVKN